VANTGQLEVDRPQGFIDRERQVQRAGVVLMAVFALAGAAGVFGSGVASHAQQTGDRLRVDYERFGRLTVRSSFNITVQTQVGDGETVTVRVEREFFNRVSMLEVRPADAHVALEKDSAIFEVPAVGGEAHLELHYEPEKSGMLRATIAVAGGGSVHVTQFVYF
jgi:hypothetical protein